MNSLIRKYNLKLARGETEQEITKKPHKQQKDGHFLNSQKFLDIYFSMQSSMDTSSNDIYAIINDKIFAAFNKCNSNSDLVYARMMEGRERNDQSQLHNATFEEIQAGLIENLPGGWKYLKALNNFAIKIFSYSFGVGNPQGTDVFCCHQKLFPSSVMNKKNFFDA